MQLARLQYGSAIKRLARLLSEIEGSSETAGPFFVLCIYILALGVYIVLMIIYKITNRVNGKIYIGQTVQRLIDRWSDHARPCLGRHKNRSAIAAAIQKYGKENFTIEQIDQASTREELNIKEQTYIKAFDCLCPNGYNMEPGGGSKACHEETKKKISATLKGRPFLNRWTGGNTKKLTDEQKAHLSALNKGKPNVALYKAVVRSDGVEFESVNAAAAAIGMNRVTVTGLLKSGKVGRAGFSFKFK